jgi:3D (Asp-Asp-Asp) domain-containing protein
MPASGRRLLLAAVIGVAGLGFHATAAESVPPAPPPAQTNVQAQSQQPGGVNAVAAYGDASRDGSAGTTLNTSQVAIAASSSGRGYWTAAADGTVRAFGDAPALGGATGPAAPIVGMAAGSDGHGYWLAGSDGGVFGFGDARFYGSMGGTALNAPIVGITAAPDGRGYWLAASDGGVFGFGDARFHGAAAPARPAAPVVGLAATHTGGGYWLAASDGSVYSYGDAHYQGSLGTDPNQAPAVALAATPTGHGYWLATGRARRTPLGTFVATCYSGGGTTASGAPTSMSDVAVDPNVIPMGTHIWIDGIGSRIAQDTGGAIKGRRLDIWEPSNGQCVQFGRQAVQVYLERW